MKVTVASAFEIREGLSELYNVGLPVMLAISVKKILRSINDELAVYEPIRTQVLEKYKKGVDEKKGMYLVPTPGDDGFADFEKEYTELMINTFEIPVAGKLDVSGLEKLNANVVIKPHTLAVIDSINDTLDQEVKE